MDQSTKRRSAKAKSSTARAKAPPLSVPVAEGDESVSVAARNFVVGIGSSAGGLEALTQLVSNLPPDLGVPFVIAQHLSPTHRSLLVQLIERETSMAVREVTDDAPPEPNTVYITPANSNVVLKDGRLHLATPQAGVSPRPSVNMFFSSLSESIGEDAIGVILSGTGTDGAAGIRAIKAAGGFTMAQEPGSAKYAGMPQAAIDTGNVDWVLTPAQIAEEITLLVRSRGATATLDNQDKAPATLKKLLLKVRQRTKVDFTGYKETTLWRRIERRMLANRLNTLDDYFKFLAHDPEEIDRLCKDILISVTAFFRDADAFLVLSEIIGEIVKKKRPGDEIRVWVAGCATGEEAYSIAILFAEALKDDLTSIRLQIFATDIDTDAMAIARRGIYTQAALAEVEPRLVQRYFSPIGDGYEVAKRLRERMVFARQDLIQDPPFLRLDLISCRNVLIYFQPSLQNSVLPIFHYALTPSGYLFLGKSESISSHPDKFEMVNRQAKIFRRYGTLSKPPAFANNTLPLAANDSRHPERTRSPQETLLDAAARLYVPASVLVNSDIEILHTYGDTASFLEFPTGRPSLNLLDTVKKSWRVEVQSLLHNARQKKQSVFGRPREHKTQNEDKAVRLAVHPITGESGADRYLVCFEPVSTVSVGPRIEGGESSDMSNLAIKELQDELASTREHLQTVIEELETSNEEMQALNEELQAANEELQSTNEELETSNEELQSTNEELTTVNDELQVKANELTGTNTDLENIQNSVPYPLIVVDEHNRITRYNEPAGKLFKLTPSSIGSLTSEIFVPYGIIELPGKLARVLESNHPLEEQIEHRGSHFSLRVTPCRLLARAASGAILSLVDTTQLVEAQRSLRRSRMRLLAMMNSRAALVTVKDLKGHYEFANTAFGEVFGVDPETVTGKPEQQVLPQAIAALFRERDLAALRSADPTETQDTISLDDGEHHFLAIRFPVADETGDVDAVCTIATEITARVRAEEMLRESEELSHAILDSVRADIAVLDHSGKIFMVNEPWRQFTQKNGAPREANYWIGANYLEACRSVVGMPDADAARAGEGVGQVLAGKRETFAMQYSCDSPEQQRWFLLTASRLGWGAGGAVVTHTTITNRVLEERELRQLSQDLERHLKECSVKLSASNRELEAFAYSVSHDLKAPLRGIAGFAHALSEDYEQLLDDKGKDYLRRIMNASNNMARLIDDLLQLSRLTRSELHVEQVDLSVMAREVCEQISGAQPARKLELMITPGISSTGDPRLLRVVLDNLLSNAVKFTAPKAIGKIEFGTKERDGKTAYFVRDNGVGFDMTYKDKLFLPFHRLHQPGEFPGTGIGLAIVWRVVHLHGGEVWAESTLGYGATFYFTLGAH